MRSYYKLIWRGGNERGHETLRRNPEIPLDRRIHTAMFGDNRGLASEACGATPDSRVVRCYPSGRLVTVLRNGSLLGDYDEADVGA